ncbi:MAG: M4 family metallopeptidase [Oscillochloridaceae bacterium]|nr:M4 family metallopeptidase [Chloroflexaceae bacterium]MDW8391080.1 M4 family metallopeptidase [Oscillochloridaceae bacterium]
MKRVALIAATLMASAVLITAVPAQSQSPRDSALQRLSQDAHGAELEITWNPETGTPSFIRGNIAPAVTGAQEQATPTLKALAVVERYADLLGIADAERDLTVVKEETDELGMHHFLFQQVYRGINVYGGTVAVHFGADGETVVALSNQFVPDIHLTDTQARITADQALAAARKALPNGVLASEVRLAVYPTADHLAGAPAVLAWLVELRDDDLPARNLYVIDALNGTIVEVRSRLFEGRIRNTYDARNRRSLPGTLVRNEGQNPTGDADVDHAHDFAGATYDYYRNTHNRDSFNNRGARMISTANYGRGYRNAFWNGEQTVYGDYMAVLDIVAHEWTHAVTDHSADLEYRWQSGALNESFSDIFAAMVDRNDWLIGEDLPPFILGGREGVRDLANPPRFGQPDHTRHWLETCADSEGVHTNSGIVNKAYFNIAQAIGKDKAERIFYRALTVYLRPNSSLEDARAAALRATQDLYRIDSAEYPKVRDGFSAVGLNGQWSPRRNNCTCAASVALTNQAVFSGPLAALEAASTLYRFRDHMLNATEAGEHYRVLYEEHTGRISELLMRNPDLWTDSAHLVQAVLPGLNGLMDGRGDQQIVTPQLVKDTLAFLHRLAQADREAGGGQLANTIERERAVIDWNRLIGMTYEEAWQYIQTRMAGSVYLPLVMR